jgi:hypothetical protein
VRCRVLDHRVVLASRRALLVAALRNAAANPLQSIDEPIADHFELADVRDPRGRSGERLGNRLGDAGLRRVLGIRGQLSFEAGDLVTQRAPRGTLAGRVRDLRRRGEVALRLRQPEKASRVKRPRQLARLDADLPSRRGSVRRDSLEVRGHRRLGGDEGAGAVLRYD